jgi:hypothetical protein
MDISIANHLARLHGTLQKLSLENCGLYSDLASPSPTYWWSWFLLTFDSILPRLTQLSLLDIEHSPPPVNNMKICFAVHPHGGFCDVGGQGCRVVAAEDHALERARTWSQTLHPYAPAQV